MMGVTPVLYALYEIHIASIYVRKRASTVGNIQIFFDATKRKAAPADGLCGVFR
jgi:hypothetical protein